MIEITTTRHTQTAGHRRQSIAQQELMHAYKSVFKGFGKDANADLVLADLAEFTGYYATTERGTSSEELHRNEGNREVFARILSLLGVSGAQREALRIAALEELQISSVEGSR